MFLVCSGRRVLILRVDHTAKKIPIEQIMASSRGAAGRAGASGGRAGGQSEGGVNLTENAPKGKDACNC